MDFLNTLKPEQKEIIILRIWEDLSYKEISEITGKSEDNCKKIVSRNLKNIAANFIIFLFILFLI
ncbi:MAG: RNA polymerase sigma factor [Patescibacteria group bacterium]